MDPASMAAWVAGRGATLSDAMIAQPIPSMGGGVGVVATKRLAKHTPLISMPLSMMLTAKRARKILTDTVFPGNGSVCKFVRQLAPAEAIILCFLHIRHRRVAPTAANVPAAATAARGGDSLNSLDFFGPWVDALPPRYDNLLELTPEEVPMRLRSPRFGTKVLEEVATWRELMQQMQDAGVLPANRDPTVPATARCSAAAGRSVDGGGCSEADFIWAYNSLMSRGFSFDDEVWASMPYADYFNYDLVPNVTMMYDERSKQYKFYTCKPVAVGEQLCLCYGVYSDFELALWYGFTLGNIPAAHWTQSDKDTFLSYCLSPTQDINGVLHDSAAWVIALADSAGIGALIPPNWRRNPQIEAPGDCRVTSRGVSVAFSSVLEAMSTRSQSARAIEKSSIAGPMSEGAILRKLLEAELATFESTGASGPTGSGDPSNSVGTAEYFARFVDESTTAILEGIVGSDDATVDAIAQTIVEKGV